MPETYVWLIPLLPLLAAAWLAVGFILGLNRGETGERHTTHVAIGASALSLLVATAVAIHAMIHGAPGQLVLQPWLSSGMIQVNLSLTLDTLGLTLSVLVAAVALLTIKFSVNYLHREAGFQRFFMVMLLFTSAMQLIVLAGNAVLAFVGWELAGVSSYLLIAYAWDRPVASGNANRAFITNRIGDAGFLAAIALSIIWLGGVEWNILDRAAGLDHLKTGLIATGFLLAALAKSAQLPFAAWISRALEGPTPSSAIFYGSLMVHAGAYLMIRLEPLLWQAPVIMTLIAILGFLTAVYGWLTGLVQTDMKSSLMFSTTAQTGLIFLWIGMGWFDLAAWHMVLHIMWRAYQFLTIPMIMHMVNRSARPVPACLMRLRWLHTAALSRFWLDPVANWLLVRPTLLLARDVQNFDESVVSRVVGLPAQTGAVASLTQWEERKHGLANIAESEVGHGRGIMGHIMEGIAAALSWFEEKLVLQGGGEGLIHGIERLGFYANRIEKLLSQPRYLLLLIMVTFVVIL